MNNNSRRDCWMLREKKIIKPFEYFISFHKNTVLKTEIKWCKQPLKAPPTLAASRAESQPCCLSLYIHTYICVFIWNCVIRLSAFPVSFLILSLVFIIYSIPLFLSASTHYRLCGDLWCGGKSVEQPCSASSIIFYYKNPRASLSSVVYHVFFYC